jgi:hypothetical protein
MLVIFKEHSRKLLYLCKLAYQYNYAPTLQEDHFKGHPFYFNRYLVVSLTVRIKGKYKFTQELYFLGRYTHINF